MKFLKMKSIIIISVLLLFSEIEIYAQVTIGCNCEPIKGALLDVKYSNSNQKNSNKGIVLPRVNLEEISIPQINRNSDSDKNNFSGKEKTHIGLTIYNLTDENPTLSQGIYIWNGDRWIRSNQFWENGFIDTSEFSIIYNGSIPKVEGNLFFTKTRGNKPIKLNNGLILGQRNGITLSVSGEQVLSDNRSIIHVKQSGTLTNTSSFNLPIYIKEIMRQPAIIEITVNP